MAAPRAYPLMRGRDLAPFPCSAASLPPCFGSFGGETRGCRVRRESRSILFCVCFMIHEVDELKTELCFGGAFIERGSRGLCVILWCYH